MKYMKKILCLALACVMCSQICGVTGEATETTTWKVSDYPDLPPGSSLHQWEDSLISYSSKAKLNITSITSGIIVNYSVPGALAGGNHNFSTTVAGYTVKVESGRVYTHKIKYVQFVSRRSSAKGNIVH